MGVFSTAEEDKVCCFFSPVCVNNNLHGKHGK